MMVNVYSYTKVNGKISDLIYINETIDKNDIQKLQNKYRTLENCKRIEKSNGRAIYVPEIFFNFGDILSDKKEKKAQQKQNEHVFQPTNRPIEELIYFKNKRL